MKWSLEKEASISDEVGRGRTENAPGASLRYVLLRISRPSLVPGERRTNSHRRIADCGECHRQETNRLLENVEVLQTGEDGGRVELVTAQTVRDEGDYVGDVRISSTR